MFRTYALDLGLYTNAMYEYAHGILPDHSMIDANSGNPLLAAHFDLYLILLSPLTFVFGTYTLLIVQWAAVIIGGFGITKVFANRGRVQILAILFYFIFFGVIGAFGYDAHSNVIAASLIPWYYLYLQKNKVYKSYVLLVLILISKENAGLWLFFFQFTLMFEWKDKPRRKIIGIQAFVSLLYFLIVVKVVIPSLSSSGEYVGLLYKQLGGSFMEVALNIIRHPIDSFSLLILNSEGGISAVKLEFIFSLLASGALFIYRKPHYIIILGFLIVQKLWHDNPQLWGVNGHYNIEFASILSLMIFTTFESSMNRIDKLLLAFLFLGTIASTVHSLDVTHATSDKAALRFYQRQHYQKVYSVSQVRDEFQKIPDNASVSAISCFVPYFSLRQDIYQFPIVKTADYIVLSKFEGPYPMKAEEYITQLKVYSESDEWINISDLDNLFIFKRKTNQVSDVGK